MKRLATRFVYWYNIKYQRVGHLFQDRFKSEPVEDDSYFLTVIRYIHQNPIKAGFCKSLSDYKYSSYNEFVTHKCMVDCDFVFNIIDKEQFVDFNNQSVFDKCLDVEDKPIVRVTDEQAQKIIFKFSKCNSVAQFQNLENSLKEKYIKKFHEKGISVRQIVRLCGETKGIVEKYSR